MISALLRLSFVTLPVLQTILSFSRSTSSIFVFNVLETVHDSRPSFTLGRSKNLCTASPSPSTACGRDYSPLPRLSCVVRRQELTSFTFLDNVKANNWIKWIRVVTRFRRYGSFSRNSIIIEHIFILAICHRDLQHHCNHLHHFSIIIIFIILASSY